MAIVKLKSVVTYRRQFIEINDCEKYKRCRVQLHRRGIKLRDVVFGSEIKTKKQRLCKKDDFIVAEMDAKFGGYGIIPEELHGAIVSSHYYLYELDKDKLLPAFLKVIIDSGVFDEQIKAVGSTNYSRVSAKEVLEYEIPCPSLDVQKKIIDFYFSAKETCSDLGEELSHQQTLLKKLRQQILQEAIEGKLTADWRAENPDVEPASELLARIKAEKEALIQAKKIKKQKPLPPITDEEKPFDLPEGWVWCRLHEVILESPRNGYSPKTVDFPAATKTLKLGATTSGKFIETEIKYINEKIPDDSFLWLENRDILIQRGNSIEFVGVSAIYSGAKRQYIYPDLMMKLKPADHVSEVYLHHVLMSPYCREYFRENATGSQKSMPKINQGIVSNTLVPLCSQKEQQAIVAKVEKLLVICDQLEAQITQNQTHAEALMQAVLKEAFQQPDIEQVVD